MDCLQHVLAQLQQHTEAVWRWSYHNCFKSVRGISTQWPSAWLSAWSVGRLPLLQVDNGLMSAVDTGLWLRRRRGAVSQLVHIFWVALTYLLSELVIWGLSRVLSLGKVEFLSSIVSMALVFLCMGAAFLLWRPVEKIYQQWIKPSVDFINTHMGIGFPVPIIMLNEDDILDGRDIACILGNAVITNVISWILVFLMAYLSWSAYLQITSSGVKASDSRGSPQPLAATPPRIDIEWYPDVSRDEMTDDTDNKPSRPGTATPSIAATGDASQQGGQPTASQSLEQPDGKEPKSTLATVWPIGLAFICVFLIGAPVSAATHDNRILDAFVLWLLWISAVSAQRAFKASIKLRRHLRARNVMATLMNPVLLTTLTMVGYTRIKAEAGRGENLADILNGFSAGSPLYALWTAKVQGVVLPTNPRAWFGAGDAALSLLECGIFVWGFKLFECRRQLFSTAGTLTVMISVFAAAGNVFLSVLAGRAMGLDKPEALAFAARSVTLALAKPAIEAVGGNMVVNAALVVGNGIFGQLMYPFILDHLGVKTEVDSPLTPSINTKQKDIDQEKQAGAESPRTTNEWAAYDDPATIAAGIATGVNGAAMGVAYLYETRSRAAPYAALSMTVFGVVTVILTTVGPFKTLVIDLAGR
ncbi:hypothetical protein CC79DRAFT_1315892 [Sarocladium strictum]